MLIIGDLVRANKDTIFSKCIGWHSTTNAKKINLIIVGEISISHIHVFRLAGRKTKMLSIMSILKYSHYINININIIISCYHNINNKDNIIIYIIYNIGCQIR